MQWKLPASVSGLPTGWPRNIDLTALTLTVGYEVRFPPKGNGSKE